MANSDSTPPLPVVAPLSSRKENATPIGSRIAELSESRTELLSRIQGLKQDLQSWRSKLDTQVKVYRDELSELKKSLNGEVEQLRSEFQELRTTLQQQQEDVTASLRNLGLQDVSGDAPLVQETKEAEVTKVDANGEEIQGASKDNVRRRRYFLVLQQRTELSSELVAVELKAYRSAVDAFTSQEIDFPFSRPDPVIS